MYAPERSIKTQACEIRILCAQAAQVRISIVNLVNVYAETGNFL